MRHNSKRPAEHYRCFYQVPKALSTLSLLEMRLLWTGLAFGKGAQLLWSYCQQRVLYLSQASEYCTAQSAYPWWMETCHPWPSIWQCRERPHTCDLTHQTRCSLQLQSPWEKARNSALHPAVRHTAGLPVNLTTEASSSSWRMEAVTRHGQHTATLSFATGLGGTQTINYLFCPTRHLFSRKVERTKNTYSLSSLCSISSKTLHTTATSNISGAIFPVLSLKASYLSRAFPMVSKC